MGHHGGQFWLHEEQTGPGWYPCSLFCLTVIADLLKESCRDLAFLEMIHASAWQACWSLANTSQLAIYPM